MSIFETSLKCRLWICLVTAMALCVSPVLLYGQTAGTGSIQGTVADSTGAVIANATVTVTETATQVKHTATTGGNGLYSFPNIKIGVYTVDIAAVGFQGYRQSNIDLEVGSSIAINVTMSVGRADQSVEVQSSGLALQTEDSSFKQTIDERTLTELPLNGRQVTSLITLSGASANAPLGDIAGSKTFFSSVVISVAGGMGNSTDYRLDGGDHNDYMTNINLPFPFPDAVNQFSVETTALGAQDGLHPGGLVNVVTRSGSNHWHGSAFEFIRNNVANATSFFSASKDTLHQNQYGGTFGGKIIRDKLFFFGGYQRLRATQTTATNQAFVPTAANLLGDFSVTDGASCQTSGVGIQLLNPLTGAVLVGNKINPSSFNATALALQKYLPATTDPCGLVKFSIPSRQTENQIVGRIDATLTQKHSLYGRYFLDGYQNPASFSPTNILITASAGNVERVQTLTVGETYVIKPTLVNSFHVTATRRRNDRGPAPGISANTIGVNTFVPFASGLQLAVSSKFSIYCGTCAPGFFNVNTFSGSDDVNMTWGKHQIAFGGEFARSQYNSRNAFEANGNFSFSGTFSQKGPTGTSPGGTGADANLDFLTGSMNTYAQSLTQQNATRAPIPSLYAQDTYHATKRLVLTVGLRWEPLFMPYDEFGRGTSFDMAAFLSNTHSTKYPNAPAGSFYYGDPGITKAFTKNSPWQFSPRLGVTFDPLGDGKTVFRAGSALVYDEPNFFTGTGVTQNPPFATATVNNPSGGPLNFTNPWASGTVIGDPYPQAYPPTPATAIFPNGGTYKVFPAHFHSLYVMQWTASMQHEFGRGWQFQIDYIGNKTSFAPIARPLDPAIYIPGQCGAAACSTLGNASTRYALTIANPAQGVKYAGGGSGLVEVGSGANASYNGMVASIQHRMSSKFTFLANYTWSHCMDVNDAQGDLEVTNVENPANINMDRANCGFDYRHIFNTAIVASSHLAVSGWKGRVLNNWQIAPLMRIVSGAPLNVTSGIDNSLTSIGNDRPNLVDLTKLYTHKAITQTIAGNRLYINASAFTQNAIGTYGNVGRNSFRGPNSFNLDAALSRNFPLHDALALNLRFEGFNVLNHPNFNNPSTSLNSATFGQISGSSAARVFQAAAKITF